MMEQFFAGGYTGAPFQLFGTPHLIALGILVLMNGALLYFGQRFPQRWRLPFRYGLAALLLVDEALWHWWNWSIGQWSIQTMLPLHLCSVFVFLSAFMLITRSYAIYEFAYFLGIAGALQAILTPDAGIYGFPHFRFFQVIISHGSIVTAAIYMTAVEKYRPTVKSLLRVFVWANVYMLVVGGINAAIGSNYLFIARKPATASVLDVMPPWPWYILGIELIGMVMTLLLYLPFAIQDWRAKRSMSSNSRFG